jgi:hypothetical protein
MEEAWSVQDVYLLTDGPEGAVAVPHLRLTLHDTGVSVERADGEPVWSSAWSEVEEMSPVERSELPGGRQGVVVVVLERGTKLHRFVLPSDDPAATEATLRRRASAHGVQTNRAKPAVSKTLTALVVVAAAAAMTLLLLSAAHVIHF